MIGSRTGSRGALYGSRVGTGTDDEGPGNLVILAGQSNSVGQAIWDNTSGVLNIDPMEGRQAAFANSLLNSQWAQSAADPPTWLSHATRSLQPYDVGGVVNMGSELTMGRGLFNNGMRMPVAKFAVSGTGITQWLPGATYPTTPPNLFSQLVTFIRARELEFGTQMGVLVWHQGETDALLNANANVYATNLAAFVSALRLQFPGFLLVVNQLSNNQSVGGDNAVTTVRTQQANYVAANPDSSVMVSTDGLFVPGGLHFSARSHETIGERVAKAILGRRGAITVGAGAGPRFVGGDTGQIWSFTTPQSYMSPNWWEFAQDGDVALLVSWGASSAAGGNLNDLSTPAGFTLIDSIISNIGATDQAWLGMWWHRKSGNMASPVLNFNNDYNSSRIFVFRGITSAGNPVDVSSKAAAGVRGTAVSVPGATTTVNGDLVVSVVCADATLSNSLSGLTNSSLTGLAVTQQGNYTLVTPSLNFQLYALGGGIKAAAGAYNATTATLSQSSKWAGMTVALKAAP